MSLWHLTTLTVKRFLCCCLSSFVPLHLVLSIKSLHSAFNTQLKQCHMQLLNWWRHFALPYLMLFLHNLFFSGTAPIPLFSFFCELSNNTNNYFWFLPHLDNGTLFLLRQALHRCPWAGYTSKQKGLLSASIVWSPTGPQAHSMLYFSSQRRAKINILSHLFGGCW